MPIHGRFHVHRLPLNQTINRYSLTAEIASAVHMRLIPWLFGILMATVCFAFVAFVTR